MNTLVKVVRFHLVDRMSYLLLPCAVTAFSFAVNLAVVAMVPTPESGAYYSGGVVAIYVFLFVAGALSATSWMPFGFALGLSRRTYFLGTVLLALVLAAGYAPALAALQALERVSGGWWGGVHFFRVPWILDGPWYLTLATSFVLLVLFFMYGMWSGLVFRRWKLPGLVVFIATQVLVLLGAALIVTRLRVWPAIGEFLATSSALGLAGWLALVAAVLALGGFGTIRRVTV